MSGRGSPEFDPMGASIVLYGVAPLTTDPGIGRWPATDLTPYKAPEPAEPESFDAIIARTKHRIEWLENELRMHTAWRSELAALRRLLEAYETLNQASQQASAHEENPK